MSLSGLPEDEQTAREGAQEPLRSSTWALPCERAAPNSQGRGLKYFGVCHSHARPARVVACQGWGPQDPRGLLAHPFLGACAPHVALRARLPLLRFRPPLPCRPWAAAMIRGGVAGLLPCCWRLLVNVDAPPCSVPCTCCCMASCGSLVLSYCATLSLFASSHGPAGPCSLAAACG